MIIALRVNDILLVINKKRRQKFTLIPVFCNDRIRKITKSKILCDFPDIKG